MDTSIYRAGNASAKAISTATIEQVVADIKDGKWAKPLQECRDSANYGEAKGSKLAAFTPSAVFPTTRSANEPFEHSNIVSADLDKGHIEFSRVDNVAHAVEVFAQDPHCVFAFISPSGEGVKAGFRIVEGVEDAIDHKRAFQALKTYLGCKGIVIDTKCSDVSRLCYVSHDPNAFYNDEATPLEWKHITRDTIEKLTLNGAMWEGEADYTLVKKFLDVPKGEEGTFDYGGEGGDSIRDARAQHIQLVLETEYSEAVSYPWLGYLIEYGDKVDPEIKTAPEDFSLRGNWVFGLATTWFRMGGSPEALYGLFMTDGLEITSMFFREWTEGPRSTGANRDARRGDRERRRTIGRALDAALNERTEIDDAIQNAIETGPTLDAEQRKVVDDVKERMTNSRKTKGKKPHEIAKEMLMAGINSDFVVQTLVEHFPDNTPIKMASTVKMTAKEIDDARKEAMDSLEWLNERHFRIRRYGKDSPVATVEEDGTITLQTHRTFKDAYSDRQILAHDAKSNVSLGEWWLTHPDSRCYERMIFDPSGAEHPDVYNLWRGLPHTPKKGDVSRIKDYLLNLLCQGVQEHYDYLMMWLAHLVQKPHIRPEVCIVLRGNEGVGKSFLAETLCRGLVGPRHYLKEMNLFNKFNAHSQTTIVMFYDEFTFRTSKRDSGMLREIISGKDRGIERKGFDRVEQPNCLHIIIASNDEQVIDANNEARRFFVLEVADREKHNSAYFAQLENHLDNGGYAALMHELMQIQGVEDRLPRPPRTKGLDVQRELSLTTFEMWWRVTLENGFIDGDEWPKSVPTDVLVDLCAAYFDRFGDRGERPPNSVHMVRNLKKLCNVERGREATGARRWIQVLPTLHKCRKMFEAATHQIGCIDWEIAAESPPPF